MHPDLVFLAIMAPGVLCQGVVSELTDGQPVALSPTAAPLASSLPASVQTHTVYATMSVTKQSSLPGANPSLNGNGCGGEVPVATYQASSQPHYTSAPAASVNTESVTYPLATNGYPVMSQQSVSSPAAATNNNSVGYPTASAAANSTISVISPTVNASSTYKVGGVQTTTSSKTGAAANIAEPAIGLALVGLIVPGLI